ncbi:hypothetical protein VitviT2T_027424 [Vitis vinifera]|uniref:Phytosulfokine n=1 Tax=Vitis vinifera TaxID=29760 RepID=A0ABY9DQ39_VITVI|nr:hypothetical protein VitviT2T_027424 [Vitis vinifera]
MITVLLLFFTVTYASRPEPTLASDSAGKLQSEGAEAVKNVEIVGESCKGVADMDGCLKKRTMVADIDYIYSVDP